MKKFIFGIFIIFSLLWTLASPTVVRADEGTPTDTPAIATDASDAGVQDAPPAVAASDTDTAVAATEAPYAVDTPVAEPTSDPAVGEATSDLSTTAVAPADQPNDAESPSEVSVTAEATVAQDAVSASDTATGIDLPVATDATPISDAVEALADSGSVLLDTQGEPIPLASQEAATILSSPDPIACPPNVKPVSWGGTGQAGIDCTTAYASIQAAIDDGLVTSGWTVFIDSGTYDENIIVNKSVTLQGAGQGATIIRPGVSNPNCSGGGSGSLCNNMGPANSVILVQANDVSIFNLTIEGDNPNLISGIGAGGADIDARNGIITDHTSGVYNNLEIGNVTVTDVYLRGIYASSGGTFDIHDNTVTNVQADPASIAIFNFGGSGIIDGNTVIDANDGIVANWSRGTQFTNNTIISSGSGIHTDNSGGFSIGSGDVIDGNTVANSDPNGYGVWAFAPFADVTISNNTITNVDVGMAAAGQNAPATVTFSNNTVTGSSQVGVYITTDQFGYGTNDVSAVLDNNTISDNAVGIYLESQDGDTLSLSGQNNCIAGNGQGVVVGTGTGYGGSLDVNLGNNWWGDASGPFNANSNPNGQGNSVDDGVPFSPVGTTDLCPQQPPSNPPPATSGGEPAGLPLTSLIPVTGGDLVALDCTLAELITLRLENNNEATFTCNVGGQAGLNEEFIETLPGKLPTGASFVTGFTTLVLTDNLPILNLPPTSHGTVSFVVPTGVDGNTLAILYWDETLNKGFGGWVTLKDPTLYDGRLSATVTYTGTFALVSK